MPNKTNFIVTPKESVKICDSKEKISLVGEHYKEPNVVFLVYIITFQNLDINYQNVDYV